MTQEEKNSTLIEAVKDKDIDSVETLLRSGADANATDYLGRTPIHLILDSYDNDDITINGRLIDLLLEYNADVNATDNLGKTPLHHICFHINSKPSSAVKQLLKNGADVNAKNNEGETPLHTVINEAFDDKENDIFTELLELVDDINVADNKGKSLLHCASKKGSKTFVTQLLKNGAEVNVIDNEYQTPLHYAVASSRFDEKKHLVVVDKLLEYEAEVHAINIYNETILNHALLSENMEMVKKVLNAGAANIKELKLNRHGDSILHIAIKTGKIELVKLLLEKEVNINIKNSNGETPLEFAKRLQEDSIADLIMHYADQSESKKNLTEVTSDLNKLSKLHLPLNTVLKYYFGTKRTAPDPPGRKHRTFLRV